MAPLAPEAALAEVEAAAVELDDDDELLPQAPTAIATADPAAAIAVNRIRLCMFPFF